MFLIAGPCVIESRYHCMFIARPLAVIAERLGLPFIFKASYDKANRTSAASARGVGWAEGRQVLQQVTEFCSTITDVHSVEDVDRLKGYTTYMQIPAMLARQTDLIQAAARTCSTINIKKSQGMSAADMRHAVAKAKSASPNCCVYVTERGTSFGYNDLVVDFRNLVEMRNIGADGVVYDASHSLQQPGGAGDRSKGARHLIAPLALAAAAVGVDGIYIETHDHPEIALCDGDIAYPLVQLEALLLDILKIDAVHHRIRRRAKQFDDLSDLPNLKDATTFARGISEETKAALAALDRQTIVGP